MKIFLFLLFFCHNAFAQLKVDFVYDGTSAQKLVHLSGTKVDSNRTPIYQVSTDVQLHFDEETREDGNGENFQVRLNDLDIGMGTGTSRGQTLTLGHLNKPSERYYDGLTWHVLFDLNIRFEKNSSSAFAFLKQDIEDMMIDDDFLSFTVAKISTLSVFNPQVIIKKVKFGRDLEVVNKIFESKDIELTEFGSDRTLVTIDLKPLLTNIDRGDKYNVEIILKNQNTKWIVFSDSFVDQASKTQSHKIDTKFRY